MNKSRNGKIARLPRIIRDELDQRLGNGEPGPLLTTWLNSHPDVQSILQKYFGGRPISQQNLSEWRQGGHQEWYNRQETRQLATDLMATPGLMGEDCKASSVGDHMAKLLTLELYRFSRQMLAKETDPNKKWQRLCSITQQISRLRHEDTRVGWINLTSQQMAHKYGVASLQPPARHQTLEPEKQN